MATGLLAAAREDIARSEVEDGIREGLRMVDGEIARLKKANGR